MKWYQQCQIFDTLGCFSHVVVWIKILLQKIRELGLRWDEIYPNITWEKWNDEFLFIKKTRACPGRFIFELKRLRMSIFMALPMLPLLPMMESSSCRSMYCIEPPSIF